MSSLTRSLTSVPQGLYETSTSQFAPLGTELVLSDRRKFAYCQVGATAAVAARLYAGPLTVANHAGTGLVCDTVAVGARVVGDITIGATALTENQYAEGYIFSVNDTANPPVPDLTAMSVSGHAAYAASASTVKVAVKDPLAGSGIEAADTIVLQANPHDGLVIQPSPPLSPCIGVPNIDVAAASYAWFQTYGPTAVLQDGAVVNGSAVVASDGVDGAVSPLNATYVVDEPVVGHVMSDTATADLGIIFLLLG